MCKQTKQKYSGCYCQTLLYEICAPHIEHTRMQVDNDPCPGLMYITTQSMTRRCRNKNGCVEKIDMFYTFENNGVRMFEDDRKKSIGLKEREEREKKAKEERERKMADREERDRAYFEEKRKKKVKKERVLERGEAIMNDLHPWTGKVKATDTDENMNVRGISWQDE